MTRLHLTKALFAAAAALSLAACSGGGSSNDGAPQSAAQSVPVISSGAVTGFGSVFVNGVRFETSSAAFTINGRPGTQADLRVGHIVRIHGHRDGAGNSTADRIDFDDLVKGPVTSVDTAAGTLVVLGQTVLVDADTSFDDNIPGGSLAGLAAGDNVEVSGMRRADGDIQATRIEGKPAGTTFEVTGAAFEVVEVSPKQKDTMAVRDEESGESAPHPFCSAQYDRVHISYQPNRRTDCALLISPAGSHLRRTPRNSSRRGSIRRKC